MKFGRNKLLITFCEINHLVKVQIYFVLYFAYLKKIIVSENKGT